MPKVSVILPVYNAASHLAEAIESIRSQSFSDFEILAIDDASTDESAEIIFSFKDPRVRYIRNDNNIGVARTLNRGIDLARGDYIARMDADDRCRLNRLAKQVDFMDSNKSVVACGTWARMRGAHGNQVFRKPHGGDLPSIYRFLDNPMIHPTVMMRFSVLKQNGLYYDFKYSRSEDYDFWNKLAQHGKLENIPEIMLDYTIHTGSITSTTVEEMERQTVMIQMREMNQIGWKMTDSEAKFHRDVGHGAKRMSLEELRSAEGWLLRFAAHDWSLFGYDKNDAKRASAYAWYYCCQASIRNGATVAKLWQKSVLSRYYQPFKGAHLRMTVASFFATLLQRLSA